MERKAEPFRRVHLSGLKIRLNFVAHFMVTPKLLFFLTLEYQCVAILLPGTRLNIYLSK